MNAQRREARKHWLTADAKQDLALLDAEGYETLLNVLRRAFLQAAHGKGNERHAQDLPFDQQPMQRLIEMYGVGFALGQAAKKSQESQRLPHERAVAELLGAINYLAGAVIAMERAHAMAPEHVKVGELVTDGVERVAHLGLHANDNQPAPSIRAPACSGNCDRRKPGLAHCQECPNV